MALVGVRLIGAGKLSLTFELKDGYHCSVIELNQIKNKRRVSGSTVVYDHVGNVKIFTESRGVKTFKEFKILLIT